MSKTNGDKLLQAVIAIQKTKDSEAFRYVYDLLSPQLYFTALRYLNDEAEAKDVLQESFVTVYLKIKKYKGKGSFEGWVKRILINNCLQRLKKRNKEELPIGEYLQHTEQNESEDEQKAELQKRLLQGLKLLPDGFRTILNLYVLENYSHKEIAQLLGIKESSSRSQLNRAKQALKKILNSHVS
ncbi:MAG: RNA polymerase sigma factor [Flavobacteriales bacterium]|nr:RNA polymerase sigma factor [Flavobacteriales bacterium]